MTAAELLDAVAGLGERSGDPLSPLYQWLLAQRNTQAQEVLANPPGKAPGRLATPGRKHRQSQPGNGVGT